MAIKFATPPNFTIKEFNKRLKPPLLNGAVNHHFTIKEFNKRLKRGNLSSL